MHAHAHTQTNKKKRKGATASGEYLASGSRDKTIKLWHVPTQQCIATLVGHDNWVRSIFFHPNGKHLISTSDDKSIRIWDLQEQRTIKTLSDAHSHFVACSAFTAKAARMATGSVDKSVKVWSCR